MNLVKFLFALISLGLTGVVGICIMLYGWGLQPQSWGWIVGGYIFISLLAAITSSFE